MKQFKVWIAIALLISAIVVLVLMLFSPRPIQIVLETGQEVTAKTPNYFTLETVMVLVICSFIIGAAITFLFFKSDNGKEAKAIQTTHKDPKQLNYDVILPLLREDEKKAVRILREHNGEILQNALVLKLGVSKVKATRIVASLERKQIVEKHRHGLTNSIRMRGE